LIRLYIKTDQNATAGQLESLTGQAIGIQDPVLDAIDALESEPTLKQ